MIWLKIETTRHNLQEIRKKIFSRSCSSWGCGGKKFLSKLSQPATFFKRQKRRKTKFHNCKSNLLLATMTRKGFTRIIFLHFLDRFGKQVRRTVDMITVTDKRKCTTTKCETYPNCGWCEWDKICLAAELNSLAKYLHWKQIYGSENIRLQKMLNVTYTRLLSPNIPMPRKSVLGSSPWKPEATWTTWILWMHYVWRLFLD